MARLPRIGPQGIAQHLIQRGNNRQICFANESDFAFYAACLKHYSALFAVDIHAWVFMTNHVHLLVTPRVDGAVSLMMQAIGRHYVRYFNRKYQRSGTLWEGRFKSCLVQSDGYLLQCQRYIELNPVRAKMVDSPANYTWSSYQCSALGKVSDLFTPHPEYLELGNCATARQEKYLSSFDNSLNNENIRNAIQKGMVLGEDSFKAQIEALCGRRVAGLKMGRPPKKV